MENVENPGPNSSGQVRGGEKIWVMGRKGAALVAAATGAEPHQVPWSLVNLDSLADVAQPDAWFEVSPRRAKKPKPIRATRA